MKDVVVAIGTIILLAIMLFIGTWYATSPSVWYSDKHDSQCEGGDHCHCYERFMNNK